MEFVHSSFEQRAKVFFNSMTSIFLDGSERFRRPTFCWDRKTFNPPFDKVLGRGSVAGTCRSVEPVNPGSNPGRGPYF